MEYEKKGDSQIIYITYNFGQEVNCVPQISFKSADFTLKSVMGLSHK